jgi:beta-galactosidase/beta-glucuronidase
MPTRQSCLAVLFALSAPTLSARAEWKPQQGPLATRWAKDVSPANALPDYPRPQMVRKEWMSLNGLWQFSPAREGDEAPAGKALAEQILVPYPMESALSGIMRHEDRAWYRRTFDLPKTWDGKKVLLHLDAVNWEAVVYLNGKKLGTHKGGYDAFGFNIAPFINPEGAQELIVGVINTPDLGNHARGKQTMKPGGIFYTPASGIWQSVWIEPVEEAFLENVHAEPDIDTGSVVITGRVIGDNKAEVKIDVLDGEKIIASADGTFKNGKAITIKIPEPKLWSPDSPFLYGLHVTLLHKGNPSDFIESYFGMRKIALGKDDKGIVRLMLNNKFVFEVGPLDQGYWPDGIYTAPTDEALKSDIQTMKKLGFNMVRKHVKVEPERWYYWCDKFGLLVWQDMPSMWEKPGGDGLEKLAKRQAGKNPLPKEKYDEEVERLTKLRGEKAPGEKEQFERELDHLIQARGNHPSIIIWVVFNEGWGQYDTERLTAHVKELDPGRLVNNASGWTDKKVGDVMDIHHYPDPLMPKPEETRASVLGEFGGLGLGLQGHTWSSKSWGYRGVGGAEQLTAAYEKMLARAWQLREQGLSAAIYTQITDVETECNGLLTYDRQVIKPNVTHVRDVNTGHVEQIPR